MTRLAVDPVLCTAHGLCAELLPEAVALDEGGHPLLVGADLPGDLVRRARRTAAACPTRALRLTRDPVRGVPVHFRGVAPDTSAEVPEEVRRRWR